ncbi:hypothetical protein CEE39_03415 [bacterium (candidate division B38) B3_B38]|nr:MAG: hypothetical protein CEE39_03415 [bacterium (candidate division B38) B3_B38]
MNHSKDRRKSLISLLMALAFLFVVCQVSYLLAADNERDREKYEEKFEKTVSIPVTGEVSVGNISGDIKVTTWDKAEVKISALKVSRADTMNRAKENADLVEINVEKVGNRVVITTEYPKNMGWRGRSINVSVNYNLTIPNRASLKANSISGDIGIGRIGGDARLKTISGDVIAREIGGEAELESVSGDITVAEAAKSLNCNTVSGDVEVTSVNAGARIKSVSGDVTLTGCRWNAEAESVSGDIELRDITGARRVRAKSVSGDIDYIGTIESGGRYTLNSHSGDITFSVPENSSFELEVKTFSGEIDTAFPIRIIGKQKKRTLSGTVGEGGAWVELESFSGNIRIRSR